MGYPLERTGVGQGRVRMATFGDGGTSFNPSGTMGKDPEDLTNPSYLTVLELAYARYKEPGYAWMLSLPPDRNTPGWFGRSPFGYLALSHGEPLPDKPTPPPAPSGVYASQGFAMIRADETPAYWTSGSLAALVTLGKMVGHGHNDHYELVLHGKGRLLYPDLNVIQYEPTYLSWTREGIGHSTLLVDHQSPASGEFTTSHDFTPEVKFFAINGSAFKNIRQTRRLLMTKEYLADVFHAADQEGQPRTFDWTLHGLGRLYPTNPAAYRRTDALVPYYWWVHQRARPDRGHALSKWTGFSAREASARGGNGVRNGSSTRWARARPCWACPGPRSTTATDRSPPASPIVSSTAARSRPPLSPWCAGRPRRPPLPPCMSPMKDRRPWSRSGAWPRTTARSPCW